MNRSLARTVLTTVWDWMLVSALSGGERARLSFARIFVSSANVLILDEPTNYLDIPSVEAIQSLLSEYEGTMLFTSHDTMFVKSVATDAYLIQNKQIISFTDL